MGKCKVCGSKGALISSKLGVCLACIRNRPEEALAITDPAHAKSRARFGLPLKPPNDPDGIACGVCANDCRIEPGNKGFCGLVVNKGGRLVRYAGTAERGLAQYYYDPLVTNCTSWWVCPGCTGAGYPKFAHSAGPEYGYYNLAVFTCACSYDCYYCQNWHFRSHATGLEPIISAEELAFAADKRVSCICWFGGDPSPQMPFALRTSELAVERARREDRIMRICWESNGHFTWPFAKRATELSLETGGVVKFDLKTWDGDLGRALCGISNRASLDNFRQIGEIYFRKRPEVPVLTASTLLVPGYVDDEEVSKIAGFIASIDERIPLSLLAFYPCHELIDLPTTSKKDAIDCLRAAQQAGLQNVRIGNIRLLS